MQTAVRPPGLAQEEMPCGGGRGTLGRAGVRMIHEGSMVSMWVTCLFDLCL